MKSDNYYEKRILAEFSAMRCENPILTNSHLNKFKIGDGFNAESEFRKYERALNKLIATNEVSKKSNGIYKYNGTREFLRWRIEMLQKESNGRIDCYEKVKINDNKFVPNNVSIENIRSEEDEDDDDDWPEIEEDYETEDSIERKEEFEADESEGEAQFDENGEYVICLDKIKLIEVNIGLYDVNLPELIIIDDADYVFDKILCCSKNKEEAKRVISLLPSPIRNELSIKLNELRCFRSKQKKLIFERRAMDLIEKIAEIDSRLTKADALRIAIARLNHSIFIEEKNEVQEICKKVVEELQKADDSDYEELKNAIFGKD